MTWVLLIGVGSWTQSTASARFKAEALAGMKGGQDTQGLTRGPSCCILSGLVLCSVLPCQKRKGRPFRASWGCNLSCVCEGKAHKDLKVALTDQLLHALACNMPSLYQTAWQ